MDKVFQLPGGQLTSVFAKSGYPSDLTLINLSGTETIYLTDQQSTAAGVGTPLGPGNVGSWNARRPLYASPGGATAAALSTSDSLSSMFPAGAVAQQLIVAGLPQAIASAITLSGVPTIDSPAVLFNSPGPAFTIIPNSTPVAFGLQDVSRYQSVILAWNEHEPVSIGTPSFARSVDIEWYADQTLSNLLDRDRVWLCADNNLGNPAINSWSAAAQHLMNLPVRGAAIRIVANAINTGNPNVARVTLIGSYRPSTNLKRFAGPYFGVSGQAVAGLPDDRYASVTFTAGKAAGIPPIVDYPGHVAGGASFLAQVNIVTGAVAECLLIDAVSGRRLAGNTFPIAGGIQELQNEITLPNRPLELYLGNTATGIASATLTIAMRGPN